MVESFVNAGFNPEFCEFLYCDNSRSNQLDAFAAYNLFLNSAKSTYIILCHQDILLKYDGIEKLEQCIRELDSLDSNWALLGNAGSIGFSQNAMRITHPNDQQNTGHFPVRVQSLDENFILAKRCANLCLSHDLHGFHFYGTDLCQIATHLGVTAWVVDFHLFHKSAGTYDSHFIEELHAISRKYRANHRSGFIQTTCALIPVGKSRWREKRAMFILLRQWNKHQGASAIPGELRDFLMKSIGRWNYVLHLVLYKMAVPYFNLRRSIRKRLATRTT
jgi:hypothetical protein